MHLFVLWLRLSQPGQRTPGTGYQSGLHRGPHHPFGFQEPCFASGSPVDYTAASENGWPLRNMQ